MSNNFRRMDRGGRTFTLAGVVLIFLSGCQGLEGGNPFKPKPKADSSQAGTSSVRLVERDVEAPDVFQATDKGLWDGRPSLGGVWVAHPDVKDPERVIIRNTANGKFVIGALFRRERANPGPVFQASSDAAAALGMLAGAPASLNVTALRREAAPDLDATPDPAAAELATDDIQATPLDPIAGAAAAIDAAETGDQTASSSPKPIAVHRPAATAPATTSPLEKPFIQIGIFSIEQNANNTAVALRQAGMVPTVLEQKSKGKAFWRVIVGPVASSSERTGLIKKIKGIGFDDAYAVTN